MEHELKFGQRPFVIGFENHLIEPGDWIVCVQPIPGYITNGKKYKCNDIIRTDRRVQIVDDNGNEAHYFAKRFKIFDGRW